MSSDWRNSGPGCSPLSGTCASANEDPPVVVTGFSSILVLRGPRLWVRLMLAYGSVIRFSAMIDATFRERIHAHNEDSIGNSPGVQLSGICRRYHRQLEAHFDKPSGIDVKSSMVRVAYTGAPAGEKTSISFTRIGDGENTCRARWQHSGGGKNMRSQNFQLHCQAFGR